MVTNPLVEQAQNSFAAYFGVDPSQVKITKGTEGEQQLHYVGGGPSHRHENVVIELPVQNSMYSSAALQGVRDQAKDWEPLKKWEWVSNVQRTKDFKKDLEDATAGLDGFDTRLINSPITNSEIAKHDYRTRSYALEDIRMGDYGVVVRMTRPRQDGVDSKPELGAMVNRINSATGNAEILAGLEEREKKNLLLMIDAKKAKGEATTELEAELGTLHDKMSKLTVKAHVDMDMNAVVVTFRSPNQVKEMDDKKVTNDYQESDNGQTIKKDNPLYLLENEMTKDNPHPAMRKVLGNVLLFEKMKDKDGKINPDSKNKRILSEAVGFLGRLDLRAALYKEFARMRREQPDKMTAEREAAIKKVLESPVLKNHYVHDPKNPDSSPPEAGVASIPGKTDMVRITLPIVGEEAGKSIEALLQAMANPTIAQPAVPAQPSPAAQETTAEAIAAAAATNNAPPSIEPPVAAPPALPPIPAILAAGPQAPASEIIAAAGQPQPQEGNWLARMKEGVGNAVSSTLGI